MMLQFKTRHCNGILLRGSMVLTSVYGITVSKFVVTFVFASVYYSFLLFKMLSPLYVAISYFSFKHKSQRLLFGL